MYTHIDPVWGYQVIEDDATGDYWYQLYTNGTGYYSAVNYSDVVSSIAALNDAQAMGLNNWALASYERVNALLTNNYGEIENYFLPTYTEQQSYTIPDMDPTCGISIPILGYSNPCNDTVVTNTVVHWSGIVDAPQTVTRWVEDRSSIDCLILGNCNYIVKTFDTHEALDYSIFDYTGTPDMPTIDTVIKLDSAEEAFVYQQDPIYGAWIVGTSVVPLPASIWFLISGLVGLISMGYRKKKRR